MKKALGFLLLLSVIVFCVWFVLPLLASVISRLNITKTATKTAFKTRPALPTIPPPLHHHHPPPPPPPAPSTVCPTAAVVDRGLVSAVVEEQIKNLLDEMLQNQKSLSVQSEQRIQKDLQGLRALLEAADSGSRLHLETEVEGMSRRLADQQAQSDSTRAELDHRIQAMEARNALDRDLVSAVIEEKIKNLLDELLQMQKSLSTQSEQRIQKDLQGFRALLEAADSGSRLRLETEVEGMSRRLADQQAQSDSTRAELDHRIQAMEAQNAWLSQELSSIQMTPPTAPLPKLDTTPPQNQLTPELQQAMEKWLTDRFEAHDISRLGAEDSCLDCGGLPLADKMADFALEPQGASVISTRCSETYRIRSACVTLFGFPLWYPTESPRTVIQGYPVLLPGKCWAFHGVQGTLLISLSHPVTITHVTLDHLPKYNSPTGRIDSAPKDFEVYGMLLDSEEGTLLGRFTYNQDGASSQTFKLQDPTDMVSRFVELRVLSNWGHMDYTCVYRFRVHGKMAAS